MSGEIMKNSKSHKTFTEEITGTISEIIKQVKKLIKKGNARRIIIQNKEGKVVFQSQLTAGIAGTAALTAVAPVISAISMFALFMNDIKIIVEKYPEEETGDSEDDYEVEAEFIEIREEEEGPKREKTDKTVGKKENKKGETESQNQEE